MKDGKRESGRSASSDASRTSRTTGASPASMLLLQLVDGHRRVPSGSGEYQSYDGPPCSKTSCNEPFTDFRVPENAEAFEEAIERVEAELGRTHPNVIDGERLSASQTFETHNPSDPDEVIGRFPLNGAAEADRAVAAADAAFPAWSETPWADRAHLLFELADRLRRERKHDFSAWMVQEIGKTWLEADADMAEAIDFLEFYAREMLRYGRASCPSRRIRGENRAALHPARRRGGHPSVELPPARSCRHDDGGASSAGNTVVLKPLGETPLDRLEVHRAARGGRLPRGVVNFVPGPGAEIGDVLVEHPRIRFIAFTGSKEVGLRINEQAAAPPPGQLWIKRVVAEMGGKDAIVVDAERRPRDAAAGVVASAFGFQGQKCSACSRAIVHRAVYDEFVRASRPGPRTSGRARRDDPEQMGPVIGERALKTIIEYIEIGRREGRSSRGGRARDGPRATSRARRSSPTCGRAPGSSRRRSSARSSP